MCCKSLTDEELRQLLARQAMALGELQFDELAGGYA